MPQKSMNHRLLFPWAPLYPALNGWSAPDRCPADGLAREEFVIMNRLLILASIVIGLAIAYIDSRPHWDDAGITAGLLLMSAGLLGLVAPQRPWLWALAIGIWIPVHTMIQHPGPKALTVLVVLVFPFAGAYAGMAMRKALFTA
jgi:hypothetical protein